MGWRDGFHRRITDPWTVVSLAIPIVVFAVVAMRSTPSPARFFLPVIALVYLAVPVVTGQVEDGEEFGSVFCYSAVLPGVALLVLFLAGMVSLRMVVLLLFALAGIGYWLWAAWVFASTATDILVAGGMTKERLGVMFVPLFTGTPLGLVMLFIGVMKGIDWATLTGLILVGLSVMTLSSLLRNR